MMDHHQAYKKDEEQCKPWGPIGIANECTLINTIFVSLMMAEKAETCCLINQL